MGEGAIKYLSKSQANDHFDRYWSSTKITITYSSDAEKIGLGREIGVSQTEQCQHWEM